MKISTSGLATLSYVYGSSSENSAVVATFKVVILIQYNNNIGSGSSVHSGNFESEMVTKIDAQDVLLVNHLHWKFRGNESNLTNKTRLEVCWDVYDWLFVLGLRHEIFIFRLVMANSICCSTSSSSSSSLASLWSSLEGS